MDVHAKYKLDNNWTCHRCSSCSGTLKYKCYRNEMELHLWPHQNKFRLFKNKTIARQGEYYDGLDLNNLQ